MKRSVFLLMSLVLYSCVSIAQKSENGYKFTPKGDLRVMVICVSFSNWCEDSLSENWSFDSPLPNWANSDYLFADTIAFQNDSLMYENTGFSNYFFQMSNKLPNNTRFRIYGDFIPVSIELPQNNPRRWDSISKIVLNKLSQEPSFLNKLSRYDNRIHNDWEKDILGQDSVYRLRYFLL